MDWIQIFLVTTAVAFIVLVIGSKKQKGWAFDSDGPLGIFLLIVIICALICAAIAAILGYYRAIELPEKYKAADRTVEEIEELLLKHEDTMTYGNLTNITIDENASVQLGITDLAKGLEAIELKQRLADAIQERNKRAADIRVWLRNSLNPFKDKVRSGLPEDFDYKG